MSTFIKMTKHPETGKWEEATWYDDMFGHHNYGVVFPSDLKKFGDNTTPKSVAFNPAVVDLETSIDV